MFKILTYFMTHPRETQHGLTVICYNTCLYDSKLRNFTFEKVELGGQSPFKGTCKKCTKDGSNKTATAVEVTATAVSACWYYIIYIKMTKPGGQRTGSECN